MVSMILLSSTRNQQNIMFHETLSEAVYAAKAELLARKAVIAPNAPCRFSPCHGGMAYGQTLSENYPLESYKGKATKKYGHITICRMDTGRYEQNNYIL